MPYRFDSFVFDPERGLLDAGESVPLEPQALGLLRYLLENRGRIVTRDELIDSIWDGRIVSEAALSTQIRAVRRALGDNRIRQRYIRTHPKRGFEFVAPVEQTDHTGDALTTGAVRQSKGRSGIRFPVAVLAAIVSLTVALAVGFWLSGRSGQGSAEARNLSIAVMPFDNLSGDPEQEYFADAITEDLITDLSRIRDAFVIARRTSFTYKDRAVDVGTVADELNVRYVLEGSVRRSGDEVRINAQLIDGKTGSHLWSDRFDREQTDVFSVQNDVTGQIASVLKAELREADERRELPAADMKAWDYALKGNVQLFNPTSFEDFQKAKAFLDKAIGLDPTISSAWSGLAFVHYVASMRPIPGVSVPNSKGLSLKAAQRAVELDPKNAEGHWIIGVAMPATVSRKSAWRPARPRSISTPTTTARMSAAGWSTWRWANRNKPSRTSSKRCASIQGSDHSPSTSTWGLPISTAVRTQRRSRFSIAPSPGHPRIRSRISL